ncbi:DUF4192 domain-containing protein [Streptomyces sp. NPDC057445]|uniref:DUF4192 domain-containing protein n=1 Tax=Streptomyces sp. NPDC057445 TaxID=3346136 RepID=UPI0036C9CFB3
MRDSNEHNKSHESHESHGRIDESHGWPDISHGRAEEFDARVDEAHDRADAARGADEPHRQAGEIRDRPDELHGRPDEPSITLRGPAELADALPYLMGFHPTDSVVMVALHGTRGRFGGRLRVGIPTMQREWLPVAEQLAECLVEAGERRGARPDGIVVFLCQDPGEGETGRTVMERLRPLAQWLRTACGSFDVPVYEALCVSDGRCWSYCCPDSRCCPAEGTVLAMQGTSVMAAAAAYAGIQVRGSLRDLEARLEPPRDSTPTEQVRALDDAASALVSRILDQESRVKVGAETLGLARRLMKRLGERTPRAVGWPEADAQDDRLISHDEAAAVILGLQDRETRDRAAAWMEGPDADHALRLWRTLARRCAGPYAEHAAAPLSLAGWVSWSTGDEPGARVALGLALRADPEYVFARLLHQACNDGLDPEGLRRCLRGKAAPETGDSGTDTSTGGGGEGVPGSHHSTVRARRRAGSVRSGRPAGKRAKRTTAPSGSEAPGADTPSRRRPTPGFTSGSGSATGRSRARTADGAHRRGPEAGR